MNFKVIQTFLVPTVGGGYCWFFLSTTLDSSSEINLESFHLMHQVKHLISVESWFPWILQRIEHLLSTPPQVCLPLTFSAWKHVSDKKVSRGKTWNLRLTVRPRAPQCGPLLLLHPPKSRATGHHLPHGCATKCCSCGVQPSSPPSAVSVSTSHEEHASNNISFFTHQCRAKQHQNKQSEG